ncbi:MAG: phosphopantetheine-binding protein [Alphaproteobacteria bacterium]|nr:phosphopantetheine-binding protein [Alphaproteobacteria bacterium]
MMYTKKICEILYDLYGDNITLTPKTNLMYDLEMDSLEFSFVIIDIEKRFNIPTLPIWDIERRTMTVERLAKKVEKAIITQQRQGAALRLKQKTK